MIIEQDADAPQEERAPRHREQPRLELLVPLLSAVNLDRGIEQNDPVFSTSYLRDKNTITCAGAMSFRRGFPATTGDDTC